MVRNFQEFLRVHCTNSYAASIFKRASEVPDAKISAAIDFTAAYKKYTIYRKMPMHVTRQERSLTIDDDSIHIMPPTQKTKAVFESAAAKTATYDVRNVSNCQQPNKDSTMFKLEIRIGDKYKRYDLEAETPQLAAEIVSNVKHLKATLDKSQWGSKSMRRSRQVS